MQKKVLEVIYDCYNSSVVYCLGALISFEAMKCIDKL